MVKLFRHGSLVMCVVVGLITATGAVSSCSDASLYGKGAGNPADDRLALTGKVCTDDPKDRGFPMRVIFLVETAAGPMFATYDPDNIRLQALRDALTLHGGNDAFSFAIIGFDSRARQLAPEEGYFSRNPGELENAVEMLSMPQPCVSEICRDYASGLKLTRSLIEGDMAELTPGERSRTQYNVVLMASALPDPLNCSHDCCDCTDENCDCDTCNLSVDCTRDLLREAIEELRENIEEQGAASFNLNVLYLAAEGDGQVDTEIMMEEAAFAGFGRYEKFVSADTITLDRLGLSRKTSLFQIKSLMVTNANTIPNAETPIIDSDGDGIGDDEETRNKLDPLKRDTDGDGIGDFVERLVSFNPRKKEDEIPVCINLEPPYKDLDADRLNDCEELLLGTEPTLPDTDGDGVMDWIEVKLGTDYLLSDTLEDADGDGAGNWDECRQHSDPRSSDAASHLGHAYRYRLDEPHYIKQPVLSEPRRIEGVNVLAAGEDTTGGLGTLRYLRKPPRLSWQDPLDDSPGRPVNVSTPGVYTLHSKTTDKEAPERWISVEVNPDRLPPDPQQELLLAEIAEKQCVNFTVSNIGLVETLKPEGYGGLNDIYIYFSEAPKGRLTLPSLYRVIHIPITYIEGKGRIPDDVTLEIKDEEFASIGF
jgi:hypothetical protein